MPHPISVANGQAAAGAGAGRRQERVVGAGQGELHAQTTDRESTVSAKQGCQKEMYTQSVL